MSKQTECTICGNKGRRFCPALEGTICPFCCGSKRGSEIRCGSNCTHYPFSIVGYDLWLKVDEALAQKMLKYIISQYGDEKFKKIVDRMRASDEIKTQNNLVTAVSAASYYVLFVECDMQGQTLADKWKTRGWEGLNNDERQMINYRFNSCVTVVEIQKVIDHQTMECIDLLDNEQKSFILIDRETASRAERFSQILTWLIRYPHFSRIGCGGMEITDFIADEFFDRVMHEARQEAKNRRGWTVKDYLTENFGICCRLVFELTKEKRDTILRSMDVHQCVATYEITGKINEVETILERYPEFDWDDKEPKEGDSPETLYYVWLRLGASKAIEKEMPRIMQYSDEEQGVGIIGDIRLYPDKLVIEVLSKKKYEFAKKMIEKYFKGLITLKDETVIDLAKQIANRKDDEVENIDVSKKNTISPDVEKEMLEEYYKNYYKKFIDDTIPVLKGKTPRQSAKDTKLRPHLIKLMKNHLRSIERQNREKNLNVNIDWILDELGIFELK